MIRTAATGLRHLRLALALLAFASGPLLAAVPEYAVKAALLYKISKFVRWPEGNLAASAGTLHVCLVGRDDFGSAIDTLSGQKLQGETIAIERLPGADPVPAGCQIAFIGRSETERLAGLLAGLAGRPTLTVSDLDGFAAQGGMVGFATSNGRISFQINVAASSRAGLEIGAQLLQLATLVSDARPGARPWSACCATGRSPPSCA